MRRFHENKQEINRKLKEKFKGRSLCCYTPATHLDISSSILPQERSSIPFFPPFLFPIGALRGEGKMEERMEEERHSNYVC